MKKTKLLILALGMSFLGTTILQAQDDSPQNPYVVFHEDFEDATNTADQALPAGWTNIASPDNPEDQWLAGQLTYEDQVFLGSSGQYYMYILGGSAPHDAWAFSPKITLEAGKEYAFRMNLIMMGYGDNITVAEIPDEMEIMIGDAPEAESMQLIVNASGTGSTSWNTYSLNQTFMPETSGDYYLGFHAISAAYAAGILIDDIYVYENAAPVLSHAGSMDFGSVVDLAPAITQSYLISNQGHGDALSLELIDASHEIQVEGLPMGIAAGQSDSLAIRFDATRPGDYQGYFVFSSNDPFHSDSVYDTVWVTAQVEAGKVSGYWYEDFESGGPEAWVFSAGAVNAADGGIDNSRSLYATTDAGQSSVTTHCIELGVAPYFRFWYRLDWAMMASMMGATGPVTSDIPIIKIEGSEDFGTTWEEVWIMEPGGENEHVESEDFQEISIDLSDYAGKALMFRLTVLPETYDMFSLFTANIDNMSIGTQHDNDLKADILSGPASIAPQTDTALYLRIENMGKNAQSGYTVQLWDNIQKNMIAAIPGSSIAANESHSLRLSWNSGNSGTRALYAKVILDNDQDTGNNLSNVLPIAVEYVEDTAIRIQGDSTLYSSNFPIDFYASECVIQSLYYANEINYISTEIHSMAYTYQFAQDYLSENFSVYIGETLKNDFSDGRFIDTSEMTKVFEGQVFFPAGTGNFVIPFSEPYRYHGGNLVVCMIKIGNEFVLGKNFLCSYGDTYRTLSNAATWGGSLDPGNLPTEGNDIKSVYPNLLLNMHPSPTGVLQGKVSDPNGPVSDVVITIAGTALQTLSDGQGKYNFSSIAEGTYALRAEKHGYFSTMTDTNVVIEAGKATVKDLSLTNIPTYTVSGTITHSQSGYPVPHTYVRMRGYDNYSTYTDQEGKYEFPEVYGDSGFVYHISATNYLYKPAGDSLTMKGKDAVFDMELSEKTLPVADVQAQRKSEAKQVDIHWNRPLPEFRYDDGIMTDNLGFPEGMYNYYFAAVFPHKAILHEAAWYTSSEGAMQTEVNIAVFPLDQYGKPATEPLYTAKAPNTPDSWSTYEFPEPIEVEGFALAVSCDAGFLGIGTTEPSEQYPFEAGTNYYNGYSLGMINWTDMWDFQHTHLMIRAVGEDLGIIKYDEPNSQDTEKAANQTEPLARPAKGSGSERPALSSPTYKSMVAKDSPVGNYSVYRLTEGLQQEDWALVGITQDTCLSDKDVYNMEEGTYQWAVVANYKSGESSARLSNPLLIRNVDNEAESTTQGIRLYPNPFSNKVYLNYASAIRSIRIVNMLGQTMTQIDKPASSVNTESLPSGLYFWLIETQDGELRTFKMVKE